MPRLGIKMSRRKLLKAESYGMKDEWQIDPYVIKAIKKKSVEMEMGTDLYEELIDDVLVVLAEMGYVELEK